MIEYENAISCCKDVFRENRCLEIVFIRTYSQINPLIKVKCYIVTKESINERKTFSFSLQFENFCVSK